MKIRTAATLVFLAILSAWPLTHRASAAECSAFEKEVAELADEAANFQESAKFREYGFGRGGPFYQWMERIEAIGGDPAGREFMGGHGFPPMHIWSVAWEYYTEDGELDSFWKDVERQIIAFRERC